MRALLWDVHGGYTDAFLHGPHQCLYLRDPDTADFGTLAEAGLRSLGANRPTNAVEVTVEELCDDPPEVVIAQRLEEVEAVERLLGRRPGCGVGRSSWNTTLPRGRCRTAGTRWRIARTGTLST